MTFYPVIKGWDLLTSFIYKCAKGGARVYIIILLNSFKCNIFSLLFHKQQESIIRLKNLLDL